MSYERFRRWMREDVLPQWSDVGVDPGTGAFREQLTLAGAADPVEYTRVRVQARQIYVFSHAHILGWRGGLAGASRAYGFLTGDGRGAGGCWPRRLNLDGRVLDATADLYDIAFVLFALAWFARAGGAGEPIDRAHATLDWLERHMASPAGGFVNTLPRRSEPRQQNPHMHLLEAALALFETTADRRFLELADRLVALCTTAFLDPATGTLGEFFNDDWSVPDGPQGDHIEPGHHYEWVWLLDRYASASGVPTSAPSKALYHFARTHGMDPRTGLAVDVVDRRGKVLDGSTRVWPQTEAIKARIAMGDSYENLVDALFDRFLDPAPTGAWHDHFDADGRLKSRAVPASSLYHLFMAFGETARATGQPHALAA